MCNESKKVYQKIWCVDYVEVRTKNNTLKAPLKVVVEEEKFETPQKLKTINWVQWDIKFFICHMIEASKSEAFNLVIVIFSIVFGSFL